MGQQAGDHSEYNFESYQGILGCSDTTDATTNTIQFRARKSMRDVPFQ